MNAVQDTPSIISVSRRSDIPAWHGAWFMHCLDEGYAEFLNPFNRKPVHVSLLPDDVLGFVFWSKNFIPFMDSLDSVARRDYPFYCHYTITGLPDLLEPCLPPVNDRLACFKHLSDRLGPDRVIWRFDPIVISNTLSPDATFERFVSLTDRIVGCTRLCCVSFVQMYRKVMRRMAELETSGDFSLSDPSTDEKRALLARMADYASQAGIRLAVCCQDDLIGGLIDKAHCVDRDVLLSHSAIILPAIPRKGTRAMCGCSFSRDIGTYNTCNHHCRYCYANI